MERVDGRDGESEGFGGRGDGGRGKGRAGGMGREGVGDLRMRKNIVCMAETYNVSSPFLPWILYNVCMAETYDVCMAETYNVPPPSLPWKNIVCIL